MTDSIWLGKAKQLMLRPKWNGETGPEVFEAATRLLELQSDDRIMGLYDRYKDDPKIRWKESIKKVVGIPVATEAGLDV